MHETPYFLRGAPHRFNPKEWVRLAMAMLYSEDVKRQLRTVTAAKAPLEVARKMVQDRLYKPADLDAMNSYVEIATLYPLGNVHRTLDDGTKVWLSEAARWFPPMEKN